jgi:hypothetical protein
MIVRAPNSIRDDTLWGIQWGLKFASIYSAYVIVLAVILARIPRESTR